MTAAQYLTVFLIFLWIDATATICTGKRFKFGFAFIYCIFWPISIPVLMLLLIINQRCKDEKN